MKLTIGRCLRLPRQALKHFQQLRHEWLLSRAYTRASATTLPRHGGLQRPRVLWVLAGNSWQASSRLKGVLLNEHANLEDCGFSSAIAYMPNEADLFLHWRDKDWRPFLDRADVVVVQTWFGNTLKLLWECRNRNIATVFTLSDFQFARVPAEILQAVSAIVVSGETLREEGLRYHGNVHFIDDPVEVPKGLRRSPGNRDWMPELVWMGHHDHWPMVVWLKELLRCEEFAPLRLRTVSRHPDATHKWSPETYWRDVSESDIAVIPCKMDDWGKGKSSNRLASFMTLGYPVIATPIPSYVRLVSHGFDGLLATSEQQWRECIRLLRNPSVREEMGKNARSSLVLRELTLHNVGKLWCALFQQLLSTTA